MFALRAFSFLLFAVVSMSALGQSATTFSSPSMRSRHRLLNKQGEVLIYSDRFDPNHITPDMPLGLQEMLRSYQIASEQKRARYSSRMPGKAVEPLLKSLRHQEYPYNMSCPYYTYDDGKVSSDPCVSGCVATALEQTVSYWRHPAVLLDTLHGWSNSHYTIPDVLPGTPIDWDNILVNYEDGHYTDMQAKAIADLTYYLGVAVKMNWGPGSSGASLFRACEPLYNAFDYKTIAFVQRGLYSNPAWNRMLRHELECGRPITYTGHNIELAGHCFNIDGVDEEGYYHINWGEENYTCYLDMDYMNPFEPYDDPTDMGMQAGVFCNQTALFMHPDDFEIDIWDTLTIDDALHSVVVDTVVFRQPPDNTSFVRADFHLRNTSSDSLNFTFEVLTYLPSDTAVFQQADFVSLTTVNLLPGEKKVWPVYCRFNECGDRLFSYSADDETLPYVLPIHVEKRRTPSLSYGEPSVQQLRLVDDKGREDLTARITFDLLNLDESGMFSDQFTYCLFEEGVQRDVRHKNIPELDAGVPYHETVDFHHLKDGQTYTFKLRFPWEVRKSITFTFRKEGAVDGIDRTPFDDDAVDCGNEINDKWYELNGRATDSPSRGIFLKKGKKVIFSR